MRHLIIKNLGPLKEADVKLGRFNLIIGKQSSGKSCVLRVACFCSWVEKQIQINQSADYFLNTGVFKKNLISYHKMDEYFQKDTFISYETKYMKFSYDNSTQCFSFAWNKDRYQYKRPKISYIPSERNVVSFIPNWRSQVSTYDCILDFMSDWDDARRYIKATKDILNLGMHYVYDESTNEDKMQLSNKKDLLLTNSSSGVQSLVPLYVCLEYFTNGLYSAETETNRTRTQKNKEQAKALRDHLFDYCIDASGNPTKDRQVAVTIDQYAFVCPNQAIAEKFVELNNNYLHTQKSDIYLEEPEDNLFPPTQCQLMDWLIELAKRRKHQVGMFVTTHSPYILTHLLENKIPDFHFFFTYQSKDGDGYIVRTATEEEIQEIYDNGVDMFFNFEAYI